MKKFIIMIIGLIVCVNFNGWCCGSCPTPNYFQANVTNSQSGFTYTGKVNRTSNFNTSYFSSGRSITLKSTTPVYGCIGRNFFISPLNVSLEFTNFENQAITDTFEESAGIEGAQGSGTSNSVNVNYIGKPGRVRSSVTNSEGYYQGFRSGNVSGFQFGEGKSVNSIRY